MLARGVCLVLCLCVLRSFASESTGNVVPRNISELRPGLYWGLHKINSAVNAYIYATEPATQAIGIGIATTGSKQTINNLQRYPAGGGSDVARTNGCMMQSYGTGGTSFYGLAYAGGMKWIDGNNVFTYTSSDLNILDIDRRYYPTFVIRKNGAGTAIRWPTKTSSPSYTNPAGSKIAMATLKATIDAADVLIPSGNPLVMDKLRYDSGSLDGYYKDRFNPNIGECDGPRRRTMFGCDTYNKCFLVVTDNEITCLTGAQAMLDLGCVNAVNLDGSRASQLRVGGVLKSPNTTNVADWKILSSDTYSYGSAVIAYNKY